MNLKRILARKFQKHFESEQIKYLKSLGVDFYENDKNNFLPTTKLKNLDISLNAIFEKNK